MLGSVLLTPAALLQVDARLRQALPSGVELTLEKASRPDAQDTLLVYLPGILAGAKSSSEGLRSHWLQHGDVLLVEYRGQRFRAEEVVERVAENVNLRGIFYDRIVFIGSSMGGLLAHDVVLELGPSAREKSTIVAIDAPTSAADFQSPLDKTSQLMRVLPFGPISNLVSGPVMSFLAVPPKERNIEIDVDRKELARRFKEMTSYPLSFYRDQVLYIISHGRLEPRSLSGLQMMIYVRSTRDNDTVRIDAYRAWWNAYGQKPVRLRIDSPHVAYAERPRTWNDAFKAVFRELGI